MKAGARRLRRQASHLQKTINTLPQSTKKALDPNYRRGQTDHHADDVPLGDIATSLREIEKNCLTLLSTRVRRGKAKYADKACLSLWRIFEECVDRPFIRTWEAVNTPDRKIAERGRREFVKTDARFIQVALYAIDPDVKFASIVKGLKAVAAQKPKSE